MEPVMPLSRREFNRALIAALSAGVLPATLAAGNASAATPTLLEGRDWAPISPPQPNEAPGKIEVLEFFSYGCSHCNELNPLIKRWEAKLPKDAQFRRVPVTFGRAAWSNLARLFYGLEASKQLDKLDQAVFDAIHLRKTNLFTEQAALDWAGSNGGNVKTLREAMRSFSVETQMARAETLVRNYKVSGVPMLTVAGRYTVVGSQARGYGDLLAIADGLIVKARQSGVASRKA
jgi:protein dithiol oxidoreductase (disulfide-forming)